MRASVGRVSVLFEQLIDHPVAGATVFAGLTSGGHVRPGLGPLFDARLDQPVRNALAATDDHPINLDFENDIQS
jgi:hypothetical protein